MKNILSLLLGVFVLAGPAYAQTPDASGTWDMNFNTPNGPIAAVLTIFGLRFAKAWLLAQEYRHRAREGRIAE